MNKLVKAALLVRPNKIKIKRIPEPKKFPGVLCRMNLSGICGTDFHIFNGRLTVPYPLILGHENVGIVEKNYGNLKDINGEILEECQRIVWHPDIPCGNCWYCNNLSGNRGKQLCENCFTYGFSTIVNDKLPLSGGWAEKICIRKNSFILKIPDFLSDEEAVLVDSLASTWNIDRVMNFSHIGPVENVVILGLGTIGILSAIRCKIRGIKNIIAVDRNSYRLKFAKKIADNLISIEKNKKDRINEVLDITNNRGADLVIDAAGTPSAFEEAIDLVRKGGTISEIGAFVDLGKASIKPVNIVHKDLFIIGQYAYPPEEYVPSLKLLKENYKKYPFKEIITHKVKLDDLPDLFEKSFIKNKEYIKIVVKL